MNLSSSLEIGKLESTYDDRNFGAKPAGSGLKSWISKFILMGLDDGHVIGIFVLLAPFHLGIPTAKCLRRLFSHVHGHGLFFSRCITTNPSVRWEFCSPRDSSSVPEHLIAAY